VVLHAPQSDIAVDIRRLVDVITDEPQRPTGSSELRISLGSKG